MALTVGTDCSGMEAPIQALQNMGIKFRHLFSCDIDQHVRSTIMANFPPEEPIYEDLTKRNNAKAPKVNFYVAGFPCQPFSSAGLQQGFEDTRGRGTIFFHNLDYIRKKKPEIFILENVKGLVSLEQGTYFEDIKKALKSLRDPGYNFYHSMMDTKQHGIPHSRQRIYMVGIRKDKDKGTFKFPEAINCPSIEAFLDPVKGKDGDLPPTSQSVARKNVRDWVRRIRTQKKEDPKKTTYIIDCDSSGPRSKAVKKVSPCITCSRRSGHWVTTRNRRFTKNEMLRLQGMRPASFKVAVSEQQLGKQVGNAMSVNVLERILVNLLPAAGFVSRKLPDRWQSGVAQKALKGGSAKRVPTPVAATTKKTKKDILKTKRK
eukprot:TRINITY_DN25523_c0_g1_i1.p1 TRINITY_DN25523_c0_g1~~TRINITY_DN25523_c0_g1_i1.p1  ORF type:complete len:397 (+),score=105.60 TRINITY_DN25523_c0_g1_i1:71-1192(+)